MWVAWGMISGYRVTIVGMDLGQTTLLRRGWHGGGGGIHLTIVRHFAQYSVESGGPGENSLVQDRAILLLWCHR